MHQLYFIFYFYFFCLGLCEGIEVHYCVQLQGPFFIIIITTPFFLIKVLG